MCSFQWGLLRRYLILRWHWPLPWEPLLEWFSAQWEVHPAMTLAASLRNENLSLNDFLPSEKFILRWHWLLPWEMRTSPTMIFCPVRNSPSTIKTPRVRSSNRNAEQRWSPHGDFSELSRNLGAKEIHADCTIYAPKNTIDLAWWSMIDHGWPAWPSRPPGWPIPPPLNLWLRSLISSILFPPSLFSFTYKLWLRELW